jgi:hypothetical protein
MPPQVDVCDFPYDVAFRDIKYPRLEFKTGTLLVVLPKGENEMRILKKHRQWIENKYQIIKEAKEAAKDLEFVSRADRVQKHCQRFDCVLLTRTGMQSRSFVYKKYGIKMGELQ